MLVKRRAHAFHVKKVDPATGEFAGYGSVFDNVDAYGDVVVKGAFSASLADWGSKGKLPPMLWQHSSWEPLGPFTQMVEDEKGLYVEGKILLDAGATEKRAHTHLVAGTVTGLSIGYYIPEGGLSYDSASGAFLLKQIDLREVSLVTFPANEEAQVDQVKSALAGGPKEFERYLREAGLSRSQAKGLMARGYEGLRELREADDEGLKAAMQKFTDTLRAARG
jgi:uncharacterized protein